MACARLHVRRDDCARYPSMRRRADPRKRHAAGIKFKEFCRTSFDPRHHNEYNADGLRTGEAVSADAVQRGGLRKDGRAAQRGLKGQFLEILAPLHLML